MPMKEDSLMKQILIELRDIVIVSVLIVLVVWVALTSISDWQSAQQAGKQGVYSSIDR